MASTRRRPRVLVLHGPNLGLLGDRDPARYGRTTLAEIDRGLAARAVELGVAIESRQSDEEGRLVAWIGAARASCAGLLINPAAYTHTSVALRDAVEASRLPAVLVHLTNLHAREDFRQRSFIGAVCVGEVQGFGPRSYLLGLEALVQIIREDKWPSG